MQKYVKETITILTFICTHIFLSYVLNEGLFGDT